MSITVALVNEHFHGSTGKLIGQVVLTPAGQGIIRAITGARKDWRAEVVTGRRTRQWFSFDDITLQNV